MKLDVLIQLLRNRQEELCTIAADEMEKLNTKYQELGRSYDAMSQVLVILVEENGKLSEKMTFDELWNEVNKLNILPDTAIAQIPLILTNDTKRKLQKMGASEVAKVISEAVDEINHGSVQTVDALVRKRLR